MRKRRTARSIGFTLCLSIILMLFACQSKPEPARKAPGGSESSRAETTLSGKTDSQKTGVPAAQEKLGTSVLKKTELTSRMLEMAHLSADKEIVNVDICEGGSNRLLIDLVCLNHNFFGHCVSKALFQYDIDADKLSLLQTFPENERLGSAVEFQGALYYSLITQNGSENTCEIHYRKEGQDTVLDASPIMECRERRFSGS